MAFDESRTAPQVRSVLLRSCDHLAVVSDALFQNGNSRVVVALLFDRLFDGLEPLGEKINPVAKYE